MKHNYLHLIISLTLILSACDNDETSAIKEDPATFSEIGSIDLGDVAASEISAYDAGTKKLFVVNNSGQSRIDVVDLTNPSAPDFISSIDITTFGGGVNSVAVYDGLLAAAVEANEKTSNGKVVVFNTNTLAKIAEVTVGALPDMVTFTPDGKLILSANEGEPNSDYSIDPIGSVSIISVASNYSVTTLDLSSFAASAQQLRSSGLRFFGPDASFAQDMEPEYITVSKNSQTAWVTLQENNAIAKIDLVTKSITSIYPLGFKNHNLSANALDASDEDNTVEFKTWNIKGAYLPDAIASFSVNGTDYVISANEGDAREYDTFEEEERVKNLDLDPTNFPNAAEIQQDEALGRLNVTTTLGDDNGDGVYESLYSFGARSFTIWNGATGALVFDSGKDLEEKLIAFDASLYDDGRSDSKGVEPEGVTVATINGKTIAFIGLERADAVLIYDVTTPTSPIFLQAIKTGDAPEGLLFIPASDSPIGKSLLVVSSEGDGFVKIYQPETL